jgi:hypothetical protein
VKTAIAISATAATLATNLIVTIAKDNGFDISDAVQDQLPTVILTLVGLVSSLYAWLSHRQTKDTLVTAQSAASDLSHENLTLAAKAAVPPSTLATSIVKQEQK